MTILHPYYGRIEWRRAERLDKINTILHDVDGVTVPVPSMLEYAWAHEADGYPGHVDPFTTCAQWAHNLEGHLARIIIGVDAEGR